MEYRYMRVPSGYTWNMLQVILNTIGIEPNYAGDTETETVLRFPRELTIGEKSQLDTIMAGDPKHPPVPVGSKFQIKDLWEFRDALKTVMALEFDIYYAESVPGSGHFDMIQMHFQTSLSNQEKNRVVSAYQNSISFVL